MQNERDMLTFSSARINFPLLQPVTFMGKAYPTAAENLFSQGHHEITDQFGVYFLTLTVTGWVDLFTRGQCRNIVLDSLAYARKAKGLRLFSYVLMSNHVHLLAAAEKESQGLSAIIRDVKRHTSKRLIETVHDHPREFRRHWMEQIFSHSDNLNERISGYRVWQPGNRPIRCISRNFTQQKLNYIHMNPVRAGIVDHPVDYRLSSARNYAGRKDYVLEVTVLDL